MTDDMKPEPDLHCINVRCPQWEIDNTCGAPDPEVATGTPDGRLKPCEDRKV